MSAGSRAADGGAIRTVGLFGNPGKAELTQAVEQIRTLCDGAGAAVLASEELAPGLPGKFPVAKNPDVVAESDVIIALGGDGTMLRTARALGTSGVPLLGVNLGSLGYLTDVPLRELGEAVSLLLEGSYHLETRSRVYCSVHRAGQRIAQYNALNEIVANMGPLTRALDMELLLDDFPVGQFLGDGLIVSTPTGSTAYSLSAGGPICHWDIPGLVVTPICPHSLGLRPLIVSSDTKIELIIRETGEGAVLAADGQKSDLLQDDDRLVFRQSHREVRLVKFPQSNFYKVMRHKLNWGGQHRSQKRGS